MDMLLDAFFTSAAISLTNRRYPRGSYLRFASRQLGKYGKAKRKGVHNNVMLSHYLKPGPRSALSLSDCTRKYRTSSIDGKKNKWIY